MSSQSKFKYNISSDLSTFSLLYPKDTPVVTPAAPPPAPILDFLTPVDEIIHLNVQEFTALGAPRARQHRNAVFHTCHGPKPINSFSDTDVALQQMVAQYPVMINFFSTMLAKMNDL